MKPLILTVTDSNFVGIASPKPCSGTLSFATQLEESPHKLTDDIMTKHTIRLFSADFKLEATQLVLDQNYSVVEAAKAMNIGKSTMDKWVSQLKEEHNEILKKATALLMSDSLNNS